MTDNGHFRVNALMIASVATIMAIMGGVATFWNARERMLWEALTADKDMRGQVAVLSTSLDALRARVHSNELSAHEASSQINARTDINAQRILRMEGIIDRIFPQGEGFKQQPTSNE